MNKLSEILTDMLKRLFIIFFSSSSMNWKLQSPDITCAFLQGNTIDREVFLQLLKDVRRKGVIWKLKGSTYWLNQAPRA